ncbi:MAG: aldehyde dehydrogenase family protein [Planctomycetota bacterium]
MEPIFCAGRFLASLGQEVLEARDPRSGELLPGRYPVSPRRELEAMVTAGKAAAAALRSVVPARRADFLERCAIEIEADADAIAARAAGETGLALKPRLREVEMARTLGQLRQAAAAVRDGGWALPTMDPQNDLRSAYFALGGPVLVIGPSNFPLAFNSMCGGDFASAIAAGNPVIGKAHPGHPGTTLLLARCIERALTACGDLPPALVQMFFHCSSDDGLWLVAHPGVSAVGFTGSRASGLRIKAAADAAGKPAYLEMSSINPVFVLPGALRGGVDQFADDFAASSLLAAGQMCTNPGLVIALAGDAADALLAAVTARLRAAPAGTLLGAGGVTQLESAVATLRSAGAQVVAGGEREPGPACRFQNTVLRVRGSEFLAASDALQTEAFGSTSLFVVVEDLDEMLLVAESLHGNLCGAIYSGTDDADEAAYRRLEPILRERVGRLMNDKMPTGVAVSPAMNHGGPYPATGHPGFTGVGFPAAIRRFAKLTCYDHVRPHRLPELLR